MDKKEFIFPGVILGLVLIIAIGLLLTQSRETTPPISSPLIASTTMAEGAGKTLSSTKTSTAITHYYPYGTTTLALNEVAGFKNAAAIRPIAVTTDSRCPAGVQCIQAGTVTISLKATSKGTSTILTPSLGDTFVYDGLTIKFASVEPLKTKDSEIMPSSYRFTFIVEPAS